MGQFGLPRAGENPVFRRRESIVKVKKAGIVTKIILAILIVYAVTTLAGLSTKIAAAKKQQAELESQVEQVSASNEEMKYAIDNKDDDDVIAGIARDKLGLVQQDEQVFYGD